MRLSLNTLVFKQFLLETLQLFILLAFASCPICVCRHFDDKDLRQIPITATVTSAAAAVATAPTITATNPITLTSNPCNTIATSEIRAVQAKASLSTSLATSLATATATATATTTTTTTTAKKVLETIALETTGITMKYEGVHVLTVTRPEYVYPTLNSGIKAINSTTMASSFDRNSQNSSNNNNNNNNNHRINSNYRKGKHTMTTTMTTICDGLSSCWFILPYKIFCCQL